MKIYFEEEALNTEDLICFPWRYFVKFQDQEYYTHKVDPHIDNQEIIYVGNSGPKERNRLLGGAFALLHPIGFEEPFGLSVVEAMVCGTPVIAFKRGAMPELILDGKTGFLVNNVEEAVEAVNSSKGKNLAAWTIISISHESYAHSNTGLFQT